jgi:hypothetical protein
VRHDSPRSYVFACFCYLPALDADAGFEEIIGSAGGGALLREQKPTFLGS